MKSASLVVAGLLATGSTAYALNQNRHQEIARDSCLQHGLPTRFCERVGVMAYNVDHFEFDDLAAHGQMPEGWSACDGANAVARREHDLGLEIHNEIWNDILTPSRATNDRLSRALGRALHTLQDNCAHSGMGNPQHAWYSLSDVCDGTSDTPDIQPEAIECARWATDGVFSAVLDVMHDNGMEIATLANVDDAQTFMTDYEPACEFLGSADRWDGVDRRWDNSIVDPQLRSILYLTIVAWDPPPLEDICATTTDELLISWDFDVDVSDGPPTCALITSFCLGKADDGGGLPPYENEPESVEAGASGCSLGHGAGGGPSAAFVLLGAALLLSARRRRRR